MNLQRYATNFAALTQAEVGAFALLLEHQFNHGSIPAETSRQEQVARGPVTKVVLDQFPVAPDGRLINDPMETHRLKSLRFREAQQAKGRLSGIARRNHGSTTVEEPFPEAVDRPTLEEVQTFAAMQLGLAPWKAEDWFNEMQGCGWLDYNHRPVRDWKAVLLRVRTKWEADGRPAGPPAARTAGTSTQPMRVNDLRQVMEAKEREAQGLRTRYAAEGPLGDTWTEPAKRIEWLKLRKEIKALNTRIATAA